MEVLPQLRGAFSLRLHGRDTLYAARDPQGIRPLVLGRLERGWVVASETAALDIVGASLVREIEPGELIAIDENGLRTPRFAAAEPKGCVFEYVYLARPDTTIAGRGVHAARVEIGRRLAKEHPAEADLVIADAGVRHPGRDRLRRGAAGSRTAWAWSRTPTSAAPSSSRRQTIRQLGIRLKLNPLRDVIEGKRLVVVDDSIVRGNTQRALVRMLREAGAREVHVRISSPAGEVAVLLRHRLRHPRRADRQRPGRRGDPRLDRRRLARYISLDGLIAATEQSGRTGSAAPASTASTRSRCPSRSCSASTCSRPSRPTPRPHGDAVQRRRTSRPRHAAGRPSEPGAS